MMNQIRTAIFISKAIPRLTLRQQAYATKFGNEKLNSEVMREEAAAKIKPEAEKSGDTDQNRVNLDTAYSTSSAKKIHNKVENLKDKYGTTDPTNTTSDANKAYNTGTVKKNTDDRSWSESIKDSAKAAKEAVKDTFNEDRIPTSTQTSYGSYSKKTITEAIKDSAMAAKEAAKDTYNKERTDSGSKKTITEAIKDSAKAAKDAAKDTYNKERTDSASKTPFTEAIKDSAKAAKEAAKETYNKERADSASKIPVTEAIKDSAKAAKDAAKDTYNKERSGSSTSSTQTNYGSGSRSTTGSSPSDYSGSRTSNSTGTQTAPRMNKEYGNVDKKPITEPIKDRNNANKDAIKETFYNENFLQEDKYPSSSTTGYGTDHSPYTTERVDQDTRSFTETAKDAAKETYNKERENYSSETTSTKKDEHTILDSIKDTAKTLKDTAMNTILGTKKEEIEYKDPATTATPAGYKVDQGRVENDTQKMWTKDAEKKRSGDVSSTNHNVSGEDKTTKMEQKTSESISDLKDKGV